MDKNICFLNSNNDSGLLAFGGGEMRSLQNGGAIDQLSEFLDKHKGQYVFLCLSYDLKNEIENLSSKNTDLSSFPDLVMWKPECVVDIKKNALEVVQGEDNPHNLGFASEFLKDHKHSTQGKQNINFEARITKEVYLKKVKELKDHIQRGDIYEINFCQEYFAQNVENEIINDFYFNINNTTKAPFSSYFKFGDFEIFCGSPERFIQKNQGRLIAQPIKGTAPRARNPSEDKALKQLLKQDPKERAENIMIVDLMRNDLSKIAKKQSVQVDALCEIHSFETVHQMISTVSCVPKENLSFTDVLKATFPMGSMTGAPKYRAMELIEAFEDFKRGLYSGSIGYISPNGDFDFNVVIRTMIYNARLKTLSCSVGSAITINSIPEKEYEECGHKIQKIIDGICR